MLDVLSAAVDQLTNVRAQELEDSQLQANVVDLPRLIDRLVAFHSGQLVEWNARKLWADDGSLSACARLSRETQQSSHTAFASLRRAKRSKSMPLSLAALANGEISTCQFDLLAQANQPALHETFARDEEMLLAAVRSNRYVDAERTIKYWVQCAKEENDADESSRQLSQRSANASRTFEGSVDLRALFEPVGGEIFLNELERLTDIMFKADWAEAKAIYGDDATVDNLNRTPTQRRSDALVEMATRSAAMPAGSAMPRPLFSVVADPITFGRICELASGTVVAPGVVMPHLTKSEIERIVFDGKSRVLDVGAKRLFVGAVRRAIKVRDRHCQDPSGCDVPASKCEVDHTLAYSKGGQTVSGNARLLCPGHNRGKGAGPP